MKQTMKKNRVK